MYVQFYIYLKVFSLSDIACKKQKEKQDKRFQNDRQADTQVIC